MDPQKVDIFLSSQMLWFSLTCMSYFLFLFFYKRYGKIWLNPILWSVLVLILALKSTGTSYDTYFTGGQYIHFWLKPAVVALGVPLYVYRSQIRQQWFSILVSQIIGSFSGMVSVIYLCKFFGASDLVTLSLVPKSVTTPIAIEITRLLGGIPPLTAVIVVFTGVFGALIGYWLFPLFGIKNPVSQALAIGTAAHAVGTYQSMSISQRYGAYSTVGLILNGLFTSVLAPLLVRWLI